MGFKAQARDCVKGPKRLELYIINASHVERGAKPLETSKIRGKDVLSTKKVKKTVTEGPIFTQVCNIARCVWCSAYGAQSATASF